MVAPFVLTKLPTVALVVASRVVATVVATVEVAAAEATAKVVIPTVRSIYLSRIAKLT